MQVELQSQKIKKQEEERGLGGGGEWGVKRRSRRKRGRVVVGRRNESHSEGKSGEGCKHNWPKS